MADLMVYIDCNTAGILGSGRNLSRYKRQSALLDNGWVGVRAPCEISAFIQMENS